MNRRDEPAAERPQRKPGRPVSVEKRQAILDAAIEEFTGTGYDYVSMDTIAARAEVSKRTLYNQFESKEGLFAALVAEVAQRIVTSTTITYDAEVGLEEQLLSYANESRLLMTRPRNVKLLRAVLGEHIRHPERVEPLLHKFWLTEYGLVEWMKRAKADGRLSGDPTLMSHMLGSMMKSVVFWPTVLGRGNPSGVAEKKQISESVGMFLAYFAARR